MRRENKPFKLFVSQNNCKIRKLVKAVYLKFNLPWGNSEDINDNLDYLLRSIPYKSLYSLNESSTDYILNSFKDYILRKSPKNCLVDGDLIQKEWFPSYNPDIFLSHSGKDKEVALKIKRALKRVGLDVFVDSTVWGCIYDLQREFDGKYCMNEDKQSYSYDKRNNSTAAVHMMLSTALTQVMDQSKYLFFLNTSNSNLGEAYDNEEFTDSPWIYHELATAKLLRQNSGFHTLLESRGFDSVKITHNVPLDDFINLDYSNFARWIRNVSRGDVDSKLLNLLSIIRN